MNNKEKKLLQEKFVKDNLEHYFNLLENNFCKELEKDYIKEIINLSQSFNIRLSKDQKLSFCKNCQIKWNTLSKEIRLNSNLKTIEHICKNCGFVRRYRYK